MDGGWGGDSGGEWKKEEDCSGPGFGKWGGLPGGDSGRKNERRFAEDRKVKKVFVREDWEGEGQWGCREGEKSKENDFSLC